MSNIVYAKINDDRLTPDMNRTRSGSTQKFRLFSDRKSENEISVEAPRRELYAELIDGVWHWVNGCDECNGRESKWTYMKCLAHEVCVDCKIPRAELKETPWGCTGGFRCKPCQSYLNEIAKQEALSKVDQDNWDESDYEHTDEVVCPHCESKYSPDEPPRGTQDCDVCGGQYEIEVNYSVSYSTKVIGERVTS